LRDAFLNRNWLVNHCRCHERRWIFSHFSPCVLLQGKEGEESGGMEEKCTKRLKTFKMWECYVFHQNWELRKICGERRMFPVKHCSNSVSLPAFGLLCCWRHLFFWMRRQTDSLTICGYLKMFSQYFRPVSSLCGGPTPVWEHPSCLPGVTFSFSVLPCCHKYDIVV